LRPTNFKSLIDTRLLIFEEYPCEPFTFLDNDKNFFSLALTLCDMLGANTFDHLVKLDVANVVYP